MKIAVDAMGGDFAPEPIVAGAVQAAEEYGLSIVLTGPEDRIKQELSKHHSASYLDIDVKHASQVVDMHDEPAAILRRKKDSSLHAAINLVRDGQADAAVSAGNTGAGMAIALMAYRPLEGIDRPALGTVMPNIKGATVIIDAGANVDCKPIHLLQFAVMGHVYAKELLQIENPRIGLMSTGEEATKGNSVTKETYEPLTQAKLNFLGNAEGHDVFNGRFDVIVCDGFVGNVLLKTSEGLAHAVKEILQEGFSKNWRTKLGYLLSKPALVQFKKRTDSSEYGGAPLLGLNQVAVIGHGSSNATALKNAIRVARESVDLQLQQKIATLLMECQFDVKSRKRATSFWRNLGKSIRHDSDKEKELAEKPEEVATKENQAIIASDQQAELPPSESEETEHERRSWWHLRETKPHEKNKDEAPAAPEPSETASETLLIGKPEEEDV